MSQAPDVLWIEQEDPGEAAPEEAAAQPAPPARRWRRWLWIAVAVVVAAATAGVALKLRNAPAPVSYQTTPVRRGAIVVQVTASGTVSALKTVLVGSQVSGRVAELHADFNDTVKKGQLLARLDTQLFKAALEQARASHALARSNVAKAQAQLAESERELARNQKLNEQKYLAQETLDAATTSAAVARAALAGARAQAQQAAANVHQAELNLEMTSIHSPIDGVVISRSVDVGQTVAASLQAPTLFTLAEDLGRMQVEAHVAEGDVAKLVAGTPVSFTVDAFPGRTFAGKLRQVRNAATTVQNVVTYDAIIDVDNHDGDLRPGMTANVSFVIADRRDVVRIPNAALRFRPPRQALPATGAPPPRPGRDQKLVFALEQGALRPIPVRVGVTDGSATELVSGDVREGTTLVTDMNDGSAPARATSAAGAAGPMAAPGMGGPMGPRTGAGGGSRRAGGL
jgi:HlyD family secretion protein